MFKYSQNIALSLISVSLCTENAKVVTHSYFCMAQYIHWSKTTHQPYSNSPQSLWGKKPLVSWNIVLMETFVFLRLKRKCVKTQISKIIMEMWCLEGPEAYLCFDESTHLGRVVNVHQNLRMLWGNKWNLIQLENKVVRDICGYEGKNKDWQIQICDIILIGHSEWL